ncbi:hypothetical protein Taro_013382 [Colocasia esculenta]|uniref:Uncharacterized protein n=1 Tax=Colocasia esculenta TaxID=4460 RepID=A0A843UGA2_COLES|nr:hypothetical protein [Colocasia esculenta]
MSSAVDLVGLALRAMFSGFRFAGSLGTLDCCFINLFLGVVYGGTGVCSSLTTWSVRGAAWFCLWALDLVEVWDVGACVVRLWSHVVVPVFHELLCLGGCEPRVASTLCLTPLVLRESCWARPWLWVMAFLCSAAL